MILNLELFSFRVDAAAFAYAMTTLGSCMINNIFSFYYVKLFINKFKISEGAFQQSQVSLSFQSERLIYFFFSIQDVR